MGRAARQKAKVKVRQPVSALVVHVKNDRQRQSLTVLQDQVLDELNVKRLEFVASAEALLSYRVKPNFRLLGPRFGSTVNAVATALQGAKPADLARKHAAGEPVMLVVNGLEVEVPVEDYDVEAVDAEGYAVIEEAGSTVALDVRLTPELIQEGLAREVVRRLNELRKDAGFRVEDRIVTYYEAQGGLAEVFLRFGNYIRQETLSVRLEPHAPPDGAYSQRVTLGEHDALLAVQRVEA
jgi:isoleucyl-tRNA synthetase